MVVLCGPNKNKYVNMSEHITSIIEYFYKWESEEPERVFLRQPQGDTWNEMTYGEAGQEARKMATVLLEKGLKPGDHVGIYSKNCLHWILADLAIMISGMVSVPYYSSLPKDQLKEVIGLSDIKALFIGKLEAWGDRVDALPKDMIAIRFPQYAGNA